MITIDFHPPIQFIHTLYKPYALHWPLPTLKASCECSGGPGEVNRGRNDKLGVMAVSQEQTSMHAMLFAVKGKPQLPTSISDHLTAC